MRFAPTLVLTALILAIAIPTTAPAAQFHVATNGNDAWSGSLATPNGQKTDGPFLTLERAHQAIRQLKQGTGIPKGGITVHVRRGLYALSKPLRFTAADSGAEGSPIIYRAQPGEEVRL